MIALLVRKCKDKELEEQHGHGWNNNDQREKKNSKFQRLTVSLFLSFFER